MPCGFVVLYLMNEMIKEIHFTELLKNLKGEIFNHFIFLTVIMLHHNLIAVINADPVWFCPLRQIDFSLYQENQHCTGCKIWSLMRYELMPKFSFQAFANLEAFCFTIVKENVQIPNLLRFLLID